MGLAVNILSAFILGSRGHAGHDHGTHAHAEHDHSGNDHHHNEKGPRIEDQNHKSAFFHVIADALTSVLALIALFAGKYFAIGWLDPAMGVIGGIVILRWAYTLLKDTAWDLLDGHPKGISLEKVRASIEESGAKVIDLQIWKVGHGKHAAKFVLHYALHMALQLQ